jgi:hypothetical protein
MTQTFQQSIAGDFATVVDNLEPITVSLNRNIPEVVTIPSANRSQMTRQMAAYSNVQLEDDDIPFSFPANELVPVNNAAEVRHLDTITDGNGIVYIVQRATLAVLQTVWLVVTRRKTP